jgi:hypothetical protein
MTTKEYLRTALQPYKSTKVVDIPMSSAPTSGAKIDGDQRFPSIKDFCEHILKYGIEGKQAPSGNLWINGANLGAYEYYYAASSFTYTEPNPDLGANIYSSTDSNKCFFFVCNGDLTFGYSVPVMRPGTPVEVSGVKQIGKKIHCVYVKGNFSNGSLTSTGESRKLIIGRGSASTDVISEEITLMPTPAGQYLYPRTAYYSSNGPGQPATGPTINTGSFTIVAGGDGYPRTTNVQYSDGLMFYGTGGSGAASSEGEAAQGGAGLPPTAWGGGGGGGGSYNKIHYASNPSFSSTYGTDADTTEIKSQTRDVLGGAGVVYGASFTPNVTLETPSTGLTGGSVVVFVTGTMANIEINTRGATGSDPFGSFVTGGGTSGSGPIFVMAKNVVNCFYIATGIGGSKNGGNGGFGTVLEFTGASF